MCEAADEDGNNELDFQEFASMMAKVHTKVGKEQVEQVIVHMASLYAILVHTYAKLHYWRTRLL